MLRASQFQYTEWQGQYLISYELSHKSKVIRTFNGGDELMLVIIIAELTYSSADLLQHAIM